MLVYLGNVRLTELARGRSTKIVMYPYSRCIIARTRINCIEKRQRAQGVGPER